MDVPVEKGLGKGVGKGGTFSTTACGTPTAYRFHLSDLFDLQDSSGPHRPRPPCPARICFNHCSPFHRPKTRAHTMLTDNRNSPCVSPQQYATHIHTCP